MTQLLCQDAKEDAPASISLKYVPYVPFSEYRNGASIFEYITCYDQVLHLFVR